MRLKQLRKAYKIAENVSVDYTGMTPKKIKELDDALDTVFKLAKEAILKAEAVDIEPQDMNKTKRVKPIVISPDPSPYRYLTKVICPRCKELLLVYDSKDPLRLPMQEGDPLDKYNYCRNCGLKLDMSDFKIRYFVTHGGI